MQEFFKKLSVAYLAGALGGAAVTLIMWLFGHWSLFKSPALTSITASLTSAHWAQPVLQGSLWALLAVPLRMVLRVQKTVFGLVLSLIPSAYLLLVAYPAQHQGLAVTSRDPKWALLILGLNAVWGLVVGHLYGSQYKA